MINKFAGTISRFNGKFREIVCGFDGFFGDIIGGSDYPAGSSRKTEY
jgi:hypothetical protein